MLTIITLKEPSNTQSLYATNHIQIIHIKYCICKYYCFHSGASLPLNVWSTAIHVIWVRDDAGLSFSCAFSRQFTACWSFRLFLVNIARFPYLSLSTSFSSIPMTYHKQFQISEPCAWDLCGELCSWIQGWMQHEGHHSDNFILNTDCSVYDSYDITHWNFLCLYCH